MMPRCFIEVPYCIGYQSFLLCIRSTLTELVRCGLNAMSGSIVCGISTARRNIAMTALRILLIGERELSTPQYLQNHHADSSFALLRCIFAYMLLVMFSTVWTEIKAPP